MRPVVVYLYLISFLIGVGAILVIPDWYWKLLIEEQPWLIAERIYLLVMTFCGFLIAYWVSADQYDIHHLRERMDDLREKINLLEKKKKSSE